MISNSPMNIKTQQLIIGFPIGNTLRGIVWNCVGLREIVHTVRAHNCARDKINLETLFDWPGFIKSICFKTTSNTHRNPEISSSFSTILWVSL